MHEVELARLQRLACHAAVHGLTDSDVGGSAMSIQEFGPQHYGLTAQGLIDAGLRGMIPSDPVREHWQKPTESDPNGIDQHAPGAKLDAGKVRPSLIISQMSRALLEVAKVGTYGANKYTDGGWQHVENGVARYTDALDRHRLKEAVEGCDSDTGLLHAAHLAWNALSRLELMLRELESAQ